MRLRDIRGTLLVTLLTAVIAPVLFVVWRDELLGPGFTTALVLGYVGLVATVVVGEARARAHPSELEGQLLRLRIRGGLLHRMSYEISELLSELRREIVQANAEGSAERLQVARERAIKAALRSLCEVLRADRIDDRLAATYFKATLFEWDATIGIEGVLRRSYWHYPITKRPQTAQFDVHHDPHAGAVQCYRKGTIIVLESVIEAAAAGRVWKDMREGQREEYANSSMVCVPVWADRDTEDTIRGVITVDTNITGYFQSSEEEIGFLNELFAPFMEIIRLVYIVTDERRQ